MRWRYCSFKQASGREAVIIIGKHAYQKCRECGKLVRITGWFAGLHICLSDEEIKAKRTEDPEG